MLVNPLGAVFSATYIDVYDSCGRILSLSEHDWTNDSKYIWHVVPTGYVYFDGFTYYSYGCISPVTTISEFTQIVYPNGILNNGSYGVENSYGNDSYPGTGYGYYICNVAQSGRANSGNLIGYIDSSYGI